MSTAPATPRPSDPAEVRNSPEIEAAYATVPDGTRAELLDGVFYLMNRPSTPHTVVASTLVGLLLPPFRFGRGGPGGWVILAEPEVHLGARPDKLGPDLAGWRRERMPRIPRETAVALPPDWVCEVLSASTEDRDRGAKMRIFRREGVRNYWLVDPVERTVEVYRLTGTRWDLVAEHRGDAAGVRLEPFDAVELDLAPLWSE